MTFSISVELLTETFEAADPSDKRHAEWPPHPARLFSALLAAARTEDERAALLWLEMQPPPIVRAAEQVFRSQRTGWVVTNRTEAKGGSQFHPARTNQLRQWPRSMPAAPTVVFGWPEAQPSSNELKQLDDLCRRVPYLGRSTGIIVMSAHASDQWSPLPDDDRIRDWVPDLEGPDMLRVPYPGYLAELVDLFDTGGPSWQANRSVAYRMTGTQHGSEEGSKPTAAPSVYDEFVVFRFEGMRPEGRLTARFTQALRQEVLRQAGQGAPVVLHGHGADGRPHVAFLGLPNVAFDLMSAQATHADGHLLGLAVAIPQLPLAEKRHIAQAILGLRRSDSDAHSMVSLSVPGIGVVDLRYDPGRVKPWGGNPERWRRGSRLWVSATPVLLDRYPKHPDQIPELIRQSVLKVGLPEPEQITVSQTPLAPGAVPMRPNDLPDKQQFRNRLFRHVMLRFERPVAGPVMVGAGRYLGVGLFAPLRDDQRAGRQEIDLTASPGARPQDPAPLGGGHRG